MTQPVCVQSVNYFHGKITREQSEELLLSRGGTEGLFLLRESVNGNYAVSICYNHRVHHYNVERQPDGSYQIPTGRRFIGPVELVRHHAQHLDGFLTLARFPLERYPTGLTYYVLQGVTAADLEERLRLKAIQMGLKGSNSIEEALSGQMREHLRQLVLKDLHHSQPWYHDAIHRSDAESRLTEAGHTEGQYLVRFRRDDNSFVLSLSFQGQAKHYKINCNMEKYQIEGGHFFNSLIEMIDHYHFRQDGLLCKLKFPVESPRHQRARSGANSTTSQSVSGASTPSSLPLSTSNTESSNTPPQQSQHHQHNHSCCTSGAGGRNSLTHSSNMLPTFSSEESSSSSSCGNTNQQSSPITSAAAAAAAAAADLISFGDSQQQTPQPGNPNLCSPFNVVTPFNIIATNNIFVGGAGGGAAAVSHASSVGGGAGTSFGGIISGSTSTSTFQQQQQQQQHPHHNQMPHSTSSTGLQQQLVFHTSPSHQHQLPAHLSAAHIITPLQITQNKLEEVCNSFSTGFTPTPTPGKFSSVIGGALNALPSGSGSSAMGGGGHKTPSSHHSTDSLDKSGAAGAAAPSAFSGVGIFGSSNASANQLLNNSGLNQPAIMDQNWEEPDLVGSRPDLSSSSPHQRLTQPSGVSLANCNFVRDLFSETTQVIYDSLPVDDDTFNLEACQIKVKEKLGGGNFGHVFGGVYSPPNENREIPVAIKMLKQDQVSHVNEDEILTEARLMARLKHRHIVRLIGVCRDLQVMLVLELAPLGPINKYLRKNRELSMLNVTELMYQVALGMAYLEASKFVHRDLAARNVLLVTEKYAKISDFGMSKALKFGNDYYRAANAGKWPIKWYAPECIYYFKFDSKSDVWSYGVTMWECYSYGERPYKDMKGTQILSMIDRGKRLSKPNDCPESIYSVMLQCWEFEGVRRPTFAELVLTMSRILNNFHTGTGGCFSVSQSAPQSRYGSGEGGSF